MQGDANGKALTIGWHAIYSNQADYPTDYAHLGYRFMEAHRRAETSDEIALTLPSSASIRWLASNKVAVITAIRVGAITFTDACERYRLSYEELSEWEAAFDQDGMAGLQLKYRSARSK